MGLPKATIIRGDFLAVSLEIACKKTPGLWTLGEVWGLCIGEGAQGAKHRTESEQRNLRIRDLCVDLVFQPQASERFVGCSI